MKKRYSLTLIEMVITTALFGVVLFVLFNSYRQTLKNKSTVANLKRIIQQVELCDRRLRYVFERLSTDEEEAVLWLQGHSDATGLALRVCFDQELDRDLQFCGKVQGMCFLDSQQQLSFVSLGKLGQPRLEILLDDVKSIEWSCFDEAGQAWVKEWPKSKEKTPKMLKLTMNWKGIERVYGYCLESPKEPITYTGPASRIEIIDEA